MRLFYSPATIAELRNDRAAVVRAAERLVDAAWQFTNAVDALIRAEMTRTRPPWLD